MATLATLTVKLQAQIAEFQADFKEAAKSTEKFQQEFQGVATKASAYGNLIARGVELGIQGFSNLGKSILENASHIVDLAAKTGLTTETIQRFQHVAQQTGTTVDAFADASFNLGRKLAGGGDSVVAAVGKLGLSFKDIQGLSPDKQFETIAVALGKMEDSNERNRLGMILFDRTFRGIAASISEGYKKLGDDATIAGFAQLKALDAAGEAWEKFQLRSLNSATGVAGGIVLAAERIRNSGFFDIIKTFGIAATAGGDPFKAFEIFAAQQAALNTPGGKDINLPAPIIPADYIKQLEEARLKIAGLSNETREQIDAARKMKATTDELTATFGLNAVELSLLNERTTASGRAYKSTNTAATEYAAVMQRIQDAQLVLTDSQKDSIDELQRYNVSISDISKALKIGESSVRSYAKATDDLASESLRAVGDAIKDVEQRIEDIGETYERDLVQVLKAVADDIEGVEQKIIDSGEDFERELTDTMKFIVSEIEGVEDRINSIEIKPEWFGTEFGQQLGNVIGNAFRGGSVRSAVEDGASLVGSTLLDKLAIKLTTGANAITGWLGGMISTALPLVGSLLGPLVGKIADAFNSLFGNRGRDLVKDFAASFGGFDSLHTRLLEMGSAGEALWIKLTQGVGRNNPQEAQAAIDAITAALGRQQAEFEALGARIGDLADIATGSGQLLDVSMIPFIKQLRTAGAITDDVAAKLLRLTTDNSLGWQEMQRLAEKYGIEIGGLGHTFQQQKLTATASEIISAFDRLVNNGADYNVVLAGMTDEINDVVLNSLKFSTEIPDNMRPWITELIASGKLLDATGEKITDIDKLKFGPAVKSDVDKLVDAIKELIAAIGTKLPAALTDLTQKRFPPIRIPIEYEDPGFTGGRAVPALAGGGIVRRRTLALVGEAGPEAVIPLNQLGAFSPASGGTTIIFEQDGRKSAEFIVPHIPGVVRRYGLV